MCIIKFHYLLKAIEKNDNKKKFQVIQHLHGISEVNHVHDDLLRPNSFYGGLLKSLYRVRTCTGNGRWD